MPQDPTPDPAQAERPLWPEMRRGWRRTCPSCGQGKLMQGYLKVADRCPSCGAEMHHHRADDGPAYLTILVVGHLLAPVLHVSFVYWRPEPLVMALVLSVLTVALALWLLPRIKGALVGIQWSRRMHGFEDAPDPSFDGTPQ